MVWKHFFVEGYYCGKCKHCKSSEELKCRQFSWVEDPFAFKISKKLLSALIFVDGKAGDLSTLILVLRLRAKRKITKIRRKIKRLIKKLRNRV